MTAVTPPVLKKRRRYNDIPSRALQLLKGITYNPEIRLALEARGYTEKEHFLGYQLVFKMGGHRPNEATRDRSPVEAFAIVSTWLETTLKITRGALERHSPAQAAFVLDGLEGAPSSQTLVVASTLLDRYEALENSPDRKATRKADHAALALLASRGIDAKQRADVRSTIAAAQTPADAPPAPPTDPNDYDRDLAALTAWYNDWSLTAHAVIKRRDFLIRMGLAKRVRRKGAPIAVPPGDANASSPPALPAGSSERLLPKKGETAA